MLPDRPPDGIHWLKSLPFFAIHLVALATPFLAPPTAGLVVLALAVYAVRMFAITAGYHRYFSHRSYRTSRGFQLVLAVLGATATQKGPLWWAAHHRDHHRFSDQPGDVHSPVLRGFWWSHVGWILARGSDAVKLDRVKDLARFPELRLVDRYYGVPPIALAAGLLAVGGWPALLWGFAVSTVILWHATFVINSLAHVVGRRRYETTDASRNSFLLAVVTFGEGWHNNHHHYQGSANQGFFWWELDLSYYVLRGLAALGLVWDLRRPPESARLAHRLPAPAPAAPALAAQAPFAAGAEAEAIRPEWAAHAP
jgi:stearoyl-CoA desaturase (Delta-9 desaturase)